MEMHDFKQGDTVTFQHYPEISVNSSEVSSKDFSTAVLQGSETNSAVNSSTDIVSMAINAAHNKVDTSNPASPASQLNSSNTVLSSSPMIQSNPGHFLKSMPTGEEFMKSLEIATATEDVSVLYTSSGQSASQVSFQSSSDVSEDKTLNSDGTSVAMATQMKDVTLATDFRGHPESVEGSAVSDQSAQNKIVLGNNYKKDTQV